MLVIARVGIPRDCFFSKNYSSTNAGPRLSNVGAVEYMVKKFGIKNIIISPNIPGVGEFSCDGVKAWGKDKGIDYHLILIDPAALDVTSVLLQAMTFKPDLLEMSLPRDGVVAFLKAGGADRSDGEDTAPTSVYNLQFPTTIGPYWDGNAYAQLELEPFDKGTPDMQNWYAVMDEPARRPIPSTTLAQAGFLFAGDHRDHDENGSGQDRPRLGDRCAAQHEGGLQVRHHVRSLILQPATGITRTMPAQYAAVTKDGKWQT